MPDLSEFMRRTGRGGLRATVRRERQVQARAAPALAAKPVAAPERDWGWSWDMPVALLRSRAAGWYGSRVQEVTVLCDGDPGPRVLCVGEAPALEECRQGAPFVGPSGGLLRKLLLRHGLGIRAGGGVLATNASLWFCAPGQSPGGDDRRAARPWLRALVQSARPAVVLCLGATAAQAVLDREGSVTRWRGRWHRPAGDLVDCLGPGAHPWVRVAWHPAYVLRTSLKEPALEADVAAVAGACRAAGPGGRP